MQTFLITLSRYLLLISVFILPNLSTAQQISGVDGDSRTGQTVTIYGIDFGEKMVSEPLLWDDLSHYQGLSDYEECPVGDDNPWPSPSWYTPEPYFFSNADSIRVPNRPLYGATRAGGLFGGHDYNLDDNSVFTVNYWFWYNNSPPSGSASVTKLIRLWADDNTTTRLDLFLNSTLTYSSAGDVAYHYFDDGIAPTETWLHFEMIVHNSSGMTTDPNTSTAYYESFLNGQKVHDTFPIVGDPADGGDISCLPRFGFDVRGSGYYDDWDEGQIIRFGDIYVDQTVARVIVAETSNYQWDNPQAIHWEIQPLIDWNTNSITVNFNAGSFEDGDEVSLYVIDGNGAISNPWPLVIDQENNASQNPPGQPGRPIIAGE